MSRKKLLGEKKGTEHPLYDIWCQIKQRCLNPNHKAYKRYGGRSITMCEKWRISFSNFYNDMISGYKKGLSIERIENDGNYEPSNCKWIPRGDQNKNRSLSHGLPKCISEYAKEWGVSRYEAKKRLRSMGLYKF